MVNRLQPARSPAELWEWLTPQDIAAVAVAALETAQIDAAREPAGEPDYVLDEFRKSFETYTSRGEFIINLAEILRIHLEILAIEKGVEVNLEHGYRNPVEQLEKWRR